MLPQFGYIIAQAGADSLAPPAPPQQPPPSLPQQHQASSLAPLLNSNKPFILPYSTHSMNHHRPNYTQGTSSPSIPPPPPSVLPPPPQQQQQQNPYLYASPFVPPSPTLKKSKNNNHKKAPMMPYNFNSTSGTDDIMMNDDNDDGILTEYNDLMTWMDNEFREQAEKIYNEKHSDLQLELQGTHSAFSDAIEEYELIREKSITDASYFMNYQLAFIEHDYDTYTIAVEEEYENEKKQLIENLLSSLQEKKKQAKEEDEDGGRTKRSLRKRNLESSTATLKSDPITNNKKRAVRTSTLPNIHTISPEEEEELEAEFVNLKLLITKSQ